MAKSGFSGMFLSKLDCNLWECSWLELRSVDDKANNLLLLVVNSVRVFIKLLVCRINEV